MTNTFAAHSTLVDCVVALLNRSSENTSLRDLAIEGNSALDVIALHDAAQQAEIKRLRAALGAAYDTLINIESVSWEESVAEAERQIIAGLETVAE